MFEPDSLMNHLGITRSEADVLLSLLDGASRVAEIMKRTGLKRPTVYYALQRLMQRGFVPASGRQQGIGRSVDLASLAHAAEQRTESIQREQQKFQTWIQTLQAQSRGKAEKPIVAFYEGTQAVRRIIMETLYANKRRIDSIAPDQNFFKKITPTFAREYIQERAARNIKTRHLWERPVAASLRTLYDTTRSEIRILPATMQGRFATTLFLYDDKTLYISSLKNAYALLVTSAEHHELMTCIYDGLWSVSKPHPR